MYAAYVCKCFHYLRLVSLVEQGLFSLPKHKFIPVDFNVVQSVDFCLFFCLLYFCHCSICLSIYGFRLLIKYLHVCTCYLYNSYLCIGHYRDL